MVSFFSCDFQKQYFAKTRHESHSGHTHLSNRKQYTQVNGARSGEEVVRYGVPQGSVLGPLLFLVYVNDISSATSNHKLRLFADDSNVFVASRDPKTLKKYMKEVIVDISNWFQANKLTINTGKTQFSIFTKPNKKIPKSLNSIKVLGNTYKRAAAAKYLGITLDDKLNWQEHIETFAGQL